MLNREKQQILKLEPEKCLPFFLDTLLNLLIKLAADKFSVDRLMNKSTNRF